MGKRLINVDEVEEIVPVLVDKLLENNLITEEQADQIICAIFNDNYLGEYSEGRCISSHLYVINELWRMIG